MVKIPGTPSGLPAVTEAIAQGVNVNITLLFSLESYLNSYQAYIQGLSKRASANHDLGQIASVASFFLSRNAQVQRLLWASTSTIEDAYNLIESLKEPDININLNAVIAEVLREGIEKFVQPFQSLMNSLEGKVRLMSTV
jgi:transaldolase